MENRIQHYPTKLTLILPPKLVPAGAPKPADGWAAPNVDAGAPKSPPEGWVVVVPVLPNNEVLVPKAGV